MVMMRSVFWDLMACCLFKVNRRFGGASHLHLQDRKISCIIALLATYLRASFLLGFIWGSEDGGDIILRTVGWLLNGLHEFTSQKTEFSQYLLCIHSLLKVLPAVWTTSIIQEDQRPRPSFEMQSNIITLKTKHPVPRGGKSGVGVV
jgi:hypothetical protein